MSTPAEARTKRDMPELAFEEHLPAGAEPSSNTPASRTFETRTGRQPELTAEDDFVITHDA